MATETPYQKTNIVDASGNVISSFGGSGGGGDASATNQATQIQLETAIRDRLPSALVGGRLAVDVQSLNVTVNNAQLEISNDVGNPIPITGAASQSDVQEVRDRIGNTAIDGVAMPSGGVGLFGWLSGIWSRLPALINGRLPIDILDGLVVNGSASTTSVLFTQETTGYQSVVVQVTSAGSGCTITYESSVDNVTYLPVIGFDLSSVGNTSPSTTTTTATQKIFPCAAKYFRARVSTFGSGSVAVSAVFRTSAFNLQSAVSGNLATGSAIAGNPVGVNYEARTTQRSATTDATVSRPITDKLGRTITKRGQIRELQQIDILTLTSPTETTLIAAGGSGIFNDITDLIISNTNPSSSARVDIRDSVAGTIRLSLQVAANSTLPINFSGTLKQSAANSAWTANLSVPVTDVRITALSEKAA